MNQRVSVCLSGCGVNDGLEIHESVITILSLDSHDVEIICLAPNIQQPNVNDHLNGNNMDEDRTELTNLVETESSRLTAMESSYEDWARRCEVEAWPVPPLTWNPKMRAPHAHRSA